MNFDDLVTEKTSGVPLDCWQASIWEDQRSIEQNAKMEAVDATRVPRQKQ